MLGAQVPGIKINQCIDAVIIVRQSHHLHFFFLINKSDIVLNGIIYFLQHPVFGCLLWQDASIKSWELPSSIGTSSPSISIKCIIYLHSHQSCHQMFDGSYPCSICFNGCASVGFNYIINICFYNWFPGKINSLKINTCIGFCRL